MRFRESRISDQLHNILEFKFPKLTSEQLRLIFKDKLIERGYSKLNNFTHQKDLINDFNIFFGDEFLNLFSSKIENKEVNWLSTLVRDSKRKHYTLKYLLLARFLDINLSELQCEKELILFDESQDEWDRNLMELASHKISIRKIGEIIGSNNATISSAFKRLGVEPYWNEKQVDRSNHSSYIETAKFKHLLEQRRETWIQYLNDYENLGTSQIKVLNKETSKIYYWLAKYDKSWFLKHHKKSFGIERIVDWTLRDIEYSPLVKESIEFMKSGKPQMITCNTVASKLGVNGWLCKNIKYLPNVKVLIDENAENIDQYRIRKILWAIKELQSTDDKVNMSNIVKMTGINYRRIKKYDLGELIKECN